MGGGARVVLAVVILFSVGCGKKAETTASLPPEINSAPQPATADNSGIRNANAPPVQPVTVAEGADPSATLAQLTQVLRRFSAEHRRVPKSLSELTDAGYLSALPPAPSAKQFAIDAKHVQVVLQSK